MKIALCLSGQIRCYREGYEYLWENLFSKHDVDVFWHTWTIDEKTMIDLESLYGPEESIYTDQFDPKQFAKYNRTQDERFRPENTIHMMYSIFMSNLLKKQHELKKGFVYDVVIRSRFDYALNVELPFADMQAGKLYVPNDKIRGFIPPNGLTANDQFAYGDSNVMDLYSMMFWNMDRAYNFGASMNGEDMLSFNIQVNQLCRENLVYIDMNNPFGPGKYNSSPHSLIRDDFAKWNKERA
jgi:hypothetical protein